MNDQNEIVCKNTYVNDDIVELPVYGDEDEPKIKEAFYLHIKHVDHHSQEEEDSSEDGDILRHTSSDTEDSSEYGN